MASRVIALEEHFATPEVMRAWASLDAVHADDMFAELTHGDLERRLLDTSGARIADMDASGIDVQVLSLTSPGVQSLEQSLAVRLARRTNNLIADRIRQVPDRFQGFATLPTPDPDAAAHELERAVTELGLAGAMIHGRTRDKTLDDRAFEPIYEAAAGLGVPLYLHPQIPQRQVRAAYYSGFGERLNLVLACPFPGWHYDLGIQLLRMILAGVFDRYPSLQVILGHWGELVLFYLDRLDQMPLLADISQNSISEYFRRNVWVTPSGIYSQRYLRWAIEIVGADRIMSSMDYPYIFDRAGQRVFLAESGLSQQDQDNIAGGNWERLVGSRTR
jgi:hypothetical protein